MKLIFTKNASGEITVQMQDGTIVVDFDYVNMIKKLMEHNEIELGYEGLEQQESDKIDELIGKITRTVHEAVELPLES